MCSCVFGLTWRSERICYGSPRLPVVNKSVDKRAPEVTDPIRWFGLPTQRALESFSALRFKVSLPFPLRIIVREKVWSDTSRTVHRKDLELKVLPELVTTRLNLNYDGG